VWAAPLGRPYGWQVPHPSKPWLGAVQGAISTNLEPSQAPRALLRVARSSPSISGGRGLDRSSNTCPVPSHVKQCPPGRPWQDPEDTDSLPLQRLVKLTLSLVPTKSNDFQHQKKTQNQTHLGSKAFVSSKCNLTPYDLKAH
jgi:hypothetical protein